MIGYWLAGLWTPTVTRVYLVSLPGVIAATLLGRYLSRRLSARQFLVGVHLFLIMIGAVLVVQAVAGRRLKI